MKQAELERGTAPSEALREVTIVIRARRAASVAITGDFTRWSSEGIRLTPRGKDEWAATVLLEPGENRYRLIVEGKLSGGFAGGRI